MKPLDIEELTLDYRAESFGTCRIVHADCLEWLGRVPSNSLHAIVTDPPYGVKEYDFDQIKKNGERQRRYLAHSAFV